MKVAIYARVSKDRCTDCGKVRELCTCAEFSGQDTANQLRELREFCAASGYSVASEYIDHASAKSGARDQFQSMLADAAKRKFGAVVVWALDRFTREGIEATFGYIRKLKDYGVDFISYSEAHFRTTGPAGSLMLAVAAWIAEQERKRISERTKAGLATARAKGKVLGRRAVPVDTERVWRMHREGLGIIPIAAALTADGAPVSKETVRKILAGSDSHGAGRSTLVN